MTSWDEQDVVWCLWVNIFKCDDVLILIDDFTRYFSGCNFAEQAVFHRTSLYLDRNFSCALFLTACGSSRLFCYGIAAAGCNAIAKPLADHRKWQGVLSGYL